MAAKATRRRYIGIDVSEEYCRIARERLASPRGGGANVKVPHVKTQSQDFDPSQGVLFRDLRG